MKARMFTSKHRKFIHQAAAMAANKYGAYKVDGVADYALFSFLKNNGLDLGMTDHEQ